MKNNYLIRISFYNKTIKKKFTRIVGFHGEEKQARHQVTCYKRHYEKNLEVENIKVELYEVTEMKHI